jgi:hypothetical protein
MSEEYKEQLSYIANSINNLADDVSKKRQEQLEYISNSLSAIASQIANERLAKLKLLDNAKLISGLGYIMQKGDELHITLENEGYRMCCKDIKALLDELASNCNTNLKDDQ